MEARVPNFAGLATPAEKAKAVTLMETPTTHWDNLIAPTTPSSTSANAPSPGQPSATKSGEMARSPGNERHGHSDRIEEPACPFPSFLVLSPRISERQKQATYLNFCRFAGRPPLLR
jgi:hypothetical protein